MGNSVQRRKRKYRYDFQIAIPLSACRGWKSFSYPPHNSHFVKEWLYCRLVLIVSKCVYLLFNFLYLILTYCSELSVNDQNYMHHLAVKFFVTKAKCHFNCSIVKLTQGIVTFSANCVINVFPVFFFFFFFGFCGHLFHDISNLSIN